jgi:hypothetical protein
VKEANMKKLTGVAILTLCGLMSTSTLVADSTVTADLVLEQLQPADALTTVRSLAGARGAEVLGERSVRVTGDADSVAVAKLVIDVAEHPSVVMGEIPTRTLADGSVLASVRLEHVSVVDVMWALRKEVEIRRIAVNSKLSTVVVRDTAAQVESALAVIRRMEASEGQ